VSLGIRGTFRVSETQGLKEKEMKITPIGVGSAFSMKNFQTNLLIENNGKNMLIDVGTDIRFALKAQDKSYKDIDSLYITHLHADHIGGIEYLAFCSYFDPSKDKIKLYGHRDVISRAWHSVWSGGLSSVQGKVVGLHDYFDVHYLEDNGSFMWEGIRFDIVQTVHIMNGYAIVPSFGLMIYGSKLIYFTSDTQFNPNQIKDFYKQADIIIQDCETAPYLSGVHAHFDELKTLDASIRSKMFLIHYQDNVDAEFEAKAIEAGFKGFCKQGEVILGYD
jgi:ribonuclease BN (tRNA processing enzyme)